MLKIFFIRFCIIVCSFFAIFNGSAAKRHIMKIALPVWASVFIIITCPCFVEAFNHTSGKMSSELMNGGFKTGEFFFQDKFNLPVLQWPFSWGRIKSFEFRINSIQKLLGGWKVNFYTVNNSTAQDGKQNTNKPARQKGERGKQINDFCHDVFVGMVIGKIIILPLFDVPLWLLLFLGIFILVIRDTSHIF